MMSFSNIRQRLPHDQFRVSRWFAIVMMTLFGIASLSAAALAAGNIVPGQEISIIVPGHVEFSSKVIVAPDGTTEYPLLAGVSLTGLSVSEVRSLLLPLLMRYESEPEVFVIVSQIQLIRTQIYGAVKTPGKFEAASPLNLQQLLAMAGGVTEEANLAEILLIQTINGRQIETKVDLSTHFYADSLSITPYLSDGDMVIVPRSSASNQIRVYGAVNDPGEVRVTKTDNLYDIILLAGGFNELADQRRLRILTKDGRISPSREFDLTSFIDGGLTDELPQVMPGDIILVPNKKIWRDYSWWILWIRDLAVLASSLVILNSTL